MATWTKPATGNKTVTGCIVGKPLIIGHKALSSIVHGSWCYINTVSGAKMGITQNGVYVIGTFEDAGNGFTCGGMNTFIVVPTATSVVLRIDGADNDDELYVYQ